jgi:hypothetical protein
MTWRSLFCSFSSRAIACLFSSSQPVAWYCSTPVSDRSVWIASIAASSTPYCLIMYIPRLCTIISALAACLRDVVVMCSPPEYVGWQDRISVRCSLPGPASCGARENRKCWIENVSSCPVRRCVTFGIRSDVLFGSRMSTVLRWIMLSTPRVCHMRARWFLVIALSSMSMGLRHWM